MSLPFPSVESEPMLRIFHAYQFARLRSGQNLYLFILCILCSLPSLAMCFIHFNVTYVEPNGGSGASVFELSKRM